MMKSGLGKCQHSANLFDDLMSSVRRQRSEDRT
jgi:hypothetical protein